MLEEPFDHRSVYLPIIRGIIPEPLQLFDFPEPSNVQGLRDSNTTPTQSLYLMNSNFAIRVAESFADKLLSDPSLDADHDRVHAAHFQCFAAAPTTEQTQRDLRFLAAMTGANAEADAESRELAWITYCQSLVTSARFRFID